MLSSNPKSRRDPWLIVQGRCPFPTKTNETHGASKSSVGSRKQLISSCLDLVIADFWSTRDIRDILQRCIDKHAPLISKKVKGRLCPWLTPDVKKEMNLRDGLLRKARRTNHENYWSSYKRQRNRVSGLVNKCKSRYNRDLLKDCADSPDKFWAAIKKLYPTKLPSEQGSAFVINGLKLTDKSLIANSFCEYFSTIARNLKSKSILLRDFVWSNPAEENLPIQVTESQFSF